MKTMSRLLRLSLAGGVVFAGALACASYFQSNREVPDPAATGAAGAASAAASPEAAKEVGPKVDVVDVNSAGRLKLVLRFPDEVDSEDLGHCLIATDDAGNPVSLRIDGVDDNAYWQRARKSRRMDVSMDVTPFQKSISLSTGSGSESAPAFTHELAVPPQFFCRGSGTASPSLDRIFSVELPFTGDLDPDQPRPRVSITPPVDGLQVHMDGSQLVLTGAFPTSTTPKVRFDSDIRGTGGWLLKGGTTTQVKVGPRQAWTGFGFDYGIISPRGNLDLPFRVCNLSKVHLQAARLDPVNLVAVLHSRSLRERLSETVSEKVVDVKLAPDEVRELSLSLKDAAGGVRGLWMVDARRSDQRSWFDDGMAFVCVSDIACVSMLDADRRNLTVWTTSLVDGRPMDGVSVEVRNAQNRVLAKGVSDASGLLRIPVPADRKTDDAWVILARKGEDVTFQKFDGLDRPGSAEALPEVPAGLDAFLYGDKGVWRGGETVRINGIVRTPSGALPPESPLDVRLVRPDGVVHARAQVTPRGEDGGFFHAEFPLGSDVPYGTYSAEVALPGSKTPLQSIRVAVAALEPLRLRTELKAAAPAATLQAKGRAVPLLVGASPAFDLSSNYRTGRPADGLPFAPQFRLDAGVVEFPAFPGFAFGFTEERSGQVMIESRANLDAKGLASIALRTKAMPGIWNLHCLATVTEPGGRSDVADARVRWINADAVAGLALDPATPPSATRPFTVRVALADALGLPAAKPADGVSLRAQRLVDNWTLQYSGGHALWRSTTEVLDVGEWSVPASAFANGIASLPVELKSVGRHRLVATAPGGAATRIEFEVPGSDVAASGRAPHRIELKPDREIFVPGSTASIAIDSPFGGTALVSTETDRVLATQVIDLPQGRGSVDVTIPATARGSVWVHVRVVRPLDPSQPEWKPVVASGHAMLNLDHGPAQLACTVDAPAKAAPGEEARVSVRITGNGGKPAVVHCWAVDTGVLDITDFKTPDPFAWYLGPKADGVGSCDSFGDLLPDFARTLERIGAGGDSAVFRGGQIKHRKPVAIVWRTVARTGADGVLTFDCKLPDHTGSLRWMAVAVQDGRYGCADAESVLTRPMQIETSAPVFVAAGDRLRVPVALFNNSGVERKVRLSVEAPDSLRVSGLPAGEIILPGDGKAWRGDFEVVVGDAQGAADLLVKVSGDFAPEPCVERLALNLRPATPLQTSATVYEVAPGETVVLPASGFIAGASQRSIHAGGNGVMAAAPLLRSLVDYPHGCVEQVSSRVRALATATAVFGLPGSDRAEGEKERISALVGMGLRRLALHQNSGGGLGYWPNADSSDLQGTLLATEAVNASQSSGLGRMEPAVIDRLVGYLRTELYSDRNSSLDLQACICSALAGLGKPEANRMRYLSENAVRLDDSGLAALAIAWHRSGDVSRGREVLASNLKPRLMTAGSAPVRNGIYTSSIEVQAQVLEALCRCQPDSPSARTLAAALSRTAEAHELNTFEQGAVLSAITSYLALHPDAATGVDTVSVSVEGQPAGVRRGMGLYWGNIPSDCPVTVRNTGKTVASIVVSDIGVPPAAKVVPVSKGLEVSRALADGVTGKPLGIGARLRVGDEVVVSLTLRATGSGDYSLVPNVALMDLFPACFEPNNPGVRNIAGDDSDSQVGRARAEMREDRAVYFTTAGSRTSTYTYRVRVIAAGDFVLPPVQAVSMYEPGIQALGETGRITIER